MTTADREDTLLPLDPYLRKQRKYNKKKKEKLERTDTSNLLLWQLYILLKTD